MKTAYYIQNKKEGKFIYKYLGIKNKPFETGYVIKTYNGYTWSLECPDDCDGTVSVKILMSLNNQTLEKRISKLESKVDGLINPVKKEVIPFPIPELTEKLTELPEKWCVRVPIENTYILYILSKWKKEVSKGFFDDIADYYDYIQNDGSVASYLHEGYTEISFSDFERLVLKKEESKDIEIGKWAEIVQDTHEDVYVKGVWDEFLKKEIDWSIPGQKVISDDALIILTTGEFSDYTFSGIVISEKDKYWAFGEYSTGWDSKRFKLHTNPVTL